MIGTVKEILSDIAPEFDDTDEEQLDRIIAVASARLSSKVFGDLYNYAVALMVAHLLTVSARQGNAGAVGAVKEGDLSINYVQSLTRSRLDNTSYGNELKILMKERIVGAGTSVR